MDKIEDAMKLPLVAVISWANGLYAPIYTVNAVIKAGSLEDREILWRYWATPIALSLVAAIPGLKWIGIPADNYLYALLFVSLLLIKLFIGPFTAYALLWLIRPVPLPIVLTAYTPYIIYTPLTTAIDIPILWNFNADIKYFNDRKLGFLDAFYYFLATKI